MTDTAVAPAAITAPSVTFGFFKFVVRDVEAMVDFYSRAFGLAVAQTIDLPDITEKVLRKPGAEGFSLILYCNKDGRELSVGTAHGPLGLYVRDVDAAFAHAVAQGATGSREPFEIGNMRIAFVHDPEGHEIELISMKR